MSSLFQSFKDSKRRFAQRIKSISQKSLLPEDTELEGLYSQFCDLKKCLSGLIEQCRALVKNLTARCEINQKIGNEMESLVVLGMAINHPIMEEFKTCVLDVHKVYDEEYDETRRIVTVVINSHIVGRLEMFLTHDTADLENTWKQRKNLGLDYESHYNRSEAYKQKGKLKQAKKFELKASHDKDMYDEHSSFLKRTLELFIDIGAKLLMSETAVLISCELFLSQHSFENLTTICNNIGEEVVLPILEEFQDIGSRIQQHEPVEKTYLAPLFMANFPEKSSYPVYIPFNTYIKNENIDLKELLASVENVEKDMKKGGREKRRRRKNGNGNGNGNELGEEGGEEEKRRKEGERDSNNGEKNEDSTKDGDDNDNKQSQSIPFQRSNAGRRRSGRNRWTNPRNRVLIYQSDEVSEETSERQSEGGVGWNTDEIVREVKEQYEREGEVDWEGRRRSREDENDDEEKEVEKPVLRRPMEMGRNRRAIQYSYPSVDGDDEMDYDSDYEEGSEDEEDEEENYDDEDSYDEDEEDEEEESDRRAYGSFARNQDEEDSSEEEDSDDTIDEQIKHNRQRVNRERNDKQSNQSRKMNRNDSESSESSENEYRTDYRNYVLNREEDENDFSRNDDFYIPRQVMAIESFHSRERGDLSFKKGDIIRVVRADESEWWTGRLKGKVGLFPITYVEVYE